MTDISKHEEEAVAQTRRWRFGTVVLDERHLELTLAGQPVKLDRKPLQVLMHLLEQAGEIVTKEELFKHVWPGLVIEESTLSKTVARLRKALQDQDQHLIKTQHGYGYRLVATVRVETVGRPAPKLDLAVGDHPPQRPLWSLVERLGSGGQGEVWLVRHDKTGEERVYKFAPDEASLSSLKREVTLNRLLNDNLHEKASAFVRVLDWNLQQPPFFIETEYLPAGSLERWVDQQGGCSQIPEETRLELAAQIAEALGLAHSMGVLHKDLKPGNVLVDPATTKLAPGVGAPDSNDIVSIKLCDFGSGGLQDRARLVDGNITQLGFTTTIGLSADSGGTPLYLAPEMLGGQSASVQADLYSFGVMLYQLIAGDLKRPLAAGWERGIADELLREDIAVLVDGDPARRLHGATEMARRLRNLDLRRQERVLLRRNEQEAGRLRVALQRSRIDRQWWRVVAGVLVLGLVVVGLLLMRVERAREEAQMQSQRAEREATTAATVNEFLLQDLIGQASPLDSGRVDMSVREVLDAAASSADRRFANQPDRERAVRLAVGRAYLQLGEYPKAEAELRTALALTPENDHRRRAVIEFHLGDTLYNLDHKEEARVALSRAALHGDPETRLLATTLLAALRSLYDDDHAAAVSELLALRPPLEAQLGAGHPRLDALIEYLCGAYINNGHYKEGVMLARELVGRINERHGQDDPRDIMAQITLGAALRWADQQEESLKVLSAVLPRARAALGENHLWTLVAARDLATAYSDLRRADEALALLEPAYNGLRSHHGAEHFETLAAQNNLAVLYGERGDHDRQIALQEQHLAILTRVEGESSQTTLLSMSNLATGYADAGRFDKAEAMQTRTLDLARKSIPDHWLTGAIAFDRAESLVSLGRFEEAHAMFEEAIRRLIETLGDDHSRVADAREKHDALRQRQRAAARDHRL
ncbi:MAG: tetratricopeptide repeat protein [Panacagrimonas sp.]